MKKLLLGIICLGWAGVVCAQDIFWSFDDAQNPLTIPAECDYKFDEIRGGVFMPTMDEMYEYGMAFLKNAALSVQQQGAYCLLGAALQGHPDAQLEMAKLYENGRVLPQDDLSAYKWSFIAALNGNKTAEKFTLLLEQYLTTDDLEKTSAAIQETRMQIQQNLQKKLEDERRQAQEDKAELEKMNTEIRLRYTKAPIMDNNIIPAVDNVIENQVEGNQLTNGGPSPEALQEANSNLVNIFTDEDRMQ